MRYDRQIDLIDIEKLSVPIHVLGCGGIGSWSTLLLAKMGCPNITIYDDDTVEDHNVASQFFKESQLGMPKVIALAENVKEQTGIELIPASIEHEKNITEGIVIIALDSMQARIYKEAIFRDLPVFIIDGRMGGLQLEIYCCSPKTYATTLCNPLDVSHDPCTARAISFNCAVIGGLIANYARLYLDGKLKEQEIIFGFNNLTLLKK